MIDVLIIGSGPAGVSAALYTVRAGLATTVVGKDKGSLAKSDAIENYYGFKEPVTGDDLVAQGIEQAKRLGVTVINDEVVGIGYDGNIIVQTKNCEFKAMSLIIATGSSRSAPKIAGIKEYEGKGVSYCAVCDAFFYRGKDVAVLGEGEYAFHEAAELLPVVKSVTVLTNGKEPNGEVPEGVKINTRNIKEFIGKDDVLNEVAFEDGSSAQISGLFIAVGVAGSSELAKKLGAETEGTKIVVDENMATSIPGVYAAGDCTGGMLQVAKAVYEGARAGTEAVKFVRKNKK
jgi:thioredoxin reductase (NADPH)